MWWCGKKKYPFKFHWMFNTPITPRNTLYSSKCFQESETNYDHWSNSLFLEMFKNICKINLINSFVLCVFKGSQTQLKTKRHADRIRQSPCYTLLLKLAVHVTWYCLLAWSKMKNPENFLSGQVENPATNPSSSLSWWFLCYRQSYKKPSLPVRALLPVDWPVLFSWQTGLWQNSDLSCSRKEKCFLWLTHRPWFRNSLSHDGCIF